MAFQRNRRTRTVESALDMTPLIDVVFLLVIFLLISTTFKKRQLSLELNLPRAGQTEFRATGTEHQLRIAGDGAMYLCPNEVLEGAADAVSCTERMSQAALTGEFKRLVKTFPGVRLGVYASGEISYKTIVKVVAAAQEAGLDLNLPYETEDALSK